jgi:hypothetical protein
MKRLLPLVLALGLASGCATFSESGARYRECLLNLQNGQKSFAVIRMMSLAKEGPDSPYAKQVTFALGEYYYECKDYGNAVRMFTRFVGDYPRDRGAIFAKIMLYKMISEFKEEQALGAQEEALIQEIRKELFSQPLFLIFYDKKSPRSYTSLLFKNSYRVYDYVDQIKVLRNDKPFLELEP